MNRTNSQKASIEKNNSITNNFIILLFSTSSLFFERTSFFKIPFLNKLIIITIDSIKRYKIENIRIMKLLVIKLFLSIEGF